MRWMEINRFPSTGTTLLAFKRHKDACVEIEFSAANFKANCGDNRSNKVTRRGQSELLIIRLVE